MTSIGLHQAASPQYCALSLHLLSLHAGNPHSGMQPQAAIRPLHSSPWGLQHRVPCSWTGPIAGALHPQPEPRGSAGLVHGLGVLHPMVQNSGDTAWSSAAGGSGSKLCWTPTSAQGSLSAPTARLQCWNHSQLTRKAEHNPTPGSATFLLPQSSHGASAPSWGIQHSPKERRREEGKHPHTPPTAPSLLCQHLILKRCEQPTNKLWLEESGRLKSRRFFSNRKWENGKEKGQNIPQGVIFSCCLYGSWHRAGSEQWGTMLSPAVLPVQGAELGPTGAELQGPIASLHATFCASPFFFSKG